jgi:hypothetical protein
MNQAHIMLIVMQLHIPLAQSLKDKRKHIKGLKERLQSRFNASVAEIDALDEWQKSVVGLTLISNDRRYLERQYSAIEQLLIEFRGVDLVDISRQWL